MLIHKVADYATSISAPDIGNTSYEAASFFLADTIGCALAGSSAKSNGIMFSAFKTDKGNFILPGRTHKVERDSAAILTAHAIHCLEWDCVHEPAVVHAMSVTTGALWAESQSRKGISGEDFLTSVIVGVDIASRLGVAANTPLRFFRPATAGLIGASAAIARMRGMNTKQATHAMSLAYSQVHGTMQAHLEGTPALAVQVALSARAALTACDMAEAGMTGPEDIFDGPFGYYGLIEESGDADKAFESLGKKYAINELSIKPYPSGRASHGILSSVLKLVHSGELDATTFSSLTAYVPPLINRLVGRSYNENMSEAYARLCIAFLVGLALRDGKIDPRQLTTTSASDPFIKAVAEKVSLVVDDNPNQNALTPQKVIIKLKNGKEHIEGIPYVLGSPNNPVSAQEHANKFTLAASVAANAISKEHSLKMLKSIHGLRSADDCCQTWNTIFKYN